MSGDAADVQRRVVLALRERIVRALGAAERARRELVEANAEIKELCDTLGIMHPSAGKLAAGLRETTQAVALLSELRERLPS